MGTPSNALQAAIYTRLTSFAALTALIGAGQVFSFLPESTQPPYVVIGDGTSLDWSTKSANGWETTLTIHCWDYEKASNKSVNDILSAIYDALHDQDAAIAVTGFNLVMIWCEFEHTMQDPGVQGQGDRYWHGIQRYRVLVHA